MVDAEGKEINTEVKSDIGIQLPRTIVDTHPNGERACPCRVMLAIFNRNSDSSSIERRITEDVTNENGTVIISEQFEDGTYILRIFPSTTGVKAYETSFVGALGLRNQQANIELDPLHTVYYSVTDITIFVGETKDRNSNSMDLNRDLLRADGLSASRLALLTLHYHEEVMLNHGA